MKNRTLAYLILSFFLALFSACTNTQRPLFELKKEKETHIYFENTLKYTHELNPYTYKNFFNGAGVGIGDINNDGLADIFLVGNLVSNRLYLNKGNFEFEDITVSAGLEVEGVWHTGVSFVDINADGWLDIYVTKSGPPGGKNRRNALYINNQDLTFSEQADAYGLDNLGLSVHAAFFDYDRDGDLDCYLLNNSFRSVGKYDLIKDQRKIPDLKGGNKLLRNDNGFFKDVSQESGIYSSEIGFGLGVSIGDLNQDNWPDIYVSNDYFERDYLYINQKGKGFSESLEDSIAELSLGSMGADLADINNDALPDIFVTEMLPQRYDRLKSKTLFESWNKQQLALRKGYYYQFGRNVLQLNNGNQTFSEIGRLAGVEATDWSWGALIFDMDNDGFKDLFVANGIYKDLLDHDYMRFMSDRPAVKKILQNETNAIAKLIDLMPSEALPNAVYQNKGTLLFEDKQQAWGFDTPSFSNGSAYGDLDNDGDLDLVVNNVNMPAFVYENKTNFLKPDTQYLRIRLKGKAKNSHAVGSKIKVFANDTVYYQELNPMRGFQSSTDYTLVFGLGKAEHIDKIEIIWPDGSQSLLNDIKPNQILLLDQNRLPCTVIEPQESIQSNGVLQLSKNKLINFKHQENPFVDFNTQQLLLEMQSRSGPCLCKADLNEDGLEDFYIGGAAGQKGKLYLQRQQAFVEVYPPLDTGAIHEDTDCEFFDANGDGILDLFISSGGSEFRNKSIVYEDRLFLGTQDLKFKASKQAVFTKIAGSTSKVLPFDFDLDGDLDLFIGTQLIPNFYGLDPDSYLLENNGKGLYRDVTYKHARQFKQLGMVKDAAVLKDPNRKGNVLFIVGHWMPIKVFSFDQGQALDLSAEWGFDNTRAWHNVIQIKDLNGDQLEDIVVGNQGLNSRLKASVQAPLKLLVNDFDKNSTVEQIFAFPIGSQYFPLHQFSELSSQLPSLKKYFLKSKDYKDASLEKIMAYLPDKQALEKKTETFETALYYNKGDFFEKQKLPIEAQFSPVMGIIIEDFDRDGFQDIALAGNKLAIKPEFGTHQASYGAFLKGSAKGIFSFLKANDSGLSSKGVIRDIITLKGTQKRWLLLARNNSGVDLYEY